MWHSAKACNAIALVLALATIPLSTRAGIVIGPPQALDADTFQLVVSLDEAFPLVDALQVNIDFTHPGLSLQSVDIDPRSPYSPQNSPQNAPQKVFARLDRVSFLFVNDQANLQPGPLLLFTFDHPTPLHGPAPVQANLRFQWVDLGGDELDVARSAMIDTAPVPEPSGVILLVAGLGLITLLRSRATAVIFDQARA